MDSARVETGDIVRYRRDFLALVVHAWDSSMAPVSGRLLELESLDRHPQFCLGWRIGVVDASSVEFVGHGEGIAPNEAQLA